MIKIWKTKEEKGDNIPKSYQSCQKIFFGDLPQSCASPTT
jgi:hypothetical protein